MIVIPPHDPSRSGSGSEKSANVLCSPFVGRYGDRSLRRPDGARCGLCVYCDCACCSPRPAVPHGSFYNRSAISVPKTARIGSRIPIFPRMPRDRPGGWSGRFLHAIRLREAFTMFFTKKKNLKTFFFR